MRMVPPMAKAHCECLSCSLAHLQACSHCSHYAHALRACIACMPVTHMRARSLHAHLLREYSGRGAAAALRVWERFTACASPPYFFLRLLLRLLPVRAATAVTLFVGDDHWLSSVEGEFFKGERLAIVRVLIVS